MNDITGDVVGINLLSHIIHVRKCIGFDALHCGHKILVFKENYIFKFKLIDNQRKRT